MRQPASIFNDVLGPVMVGPSSSHTAASARIGYLTRCLCGGAPRRVVCEFSRYGSLAFCHQGQGTDMGLAAGLLGLAADDARLPQAEALLAEAGIALSFKVTDTPAHHPNAYLLRAESARGGLPLIAEFISTGGGMMELIRLNGLPLSVDGGYHETLLLFAEEAAVRQAESLYARSLPDLEGLHRANGAGQYLLQLKLARPLSAAELAQAGPAQVLQLPPILPIQSFAAHSGLFNSAAEILAQARAEGLTLAELAIRYEARRGRLNEAEIAPRMQRLLAVMRGAIARAEAQPEYADRILGPQAQLLAAHTAFPDPTLQAILRRVTLLMEAKSSMQVIVAAPTAGSCAALPGAIIGAAESSGFSEAQMTEALLAAGLVGVLIAEHATFAAEIGGCQAECGAGSGMAAAGLVQLFGGTAEQALNAASLALQNILGLICDPVAARVEAPCLGRNILAAVNALAMAQLALAGFDPLIPLDETIAALHEVGQKIDASLRCTCGGGLSQTPTAKQIEARLDAIASKTAATE